MNELQAPTSAEELLPCPWCGGPAMIDRSEGRVVDGEVRWWAACESLSCPAYLTATSYSRRADAIAAWNTRAPASPAPTREMAALRERAIAAKEKLVDHAAHFPPKDEVTRLFIKAAMESAQATDDLLAALPSTEAIPSYAYYSDEWDNFFDLYGHGMGLAFYKHWQAKRHLFPTNRVALKPPANEEESDPGRRWRPIDSAPRDGTHIWAFTEESQQREVYWEEKEENSPGQPGHEAGWMSNDGNTYPGSFYHGYDDPIDQPTHWQPLPEPPKE
jgi:hypothetical protein